MSTWTNEKHKAAREAAEGFIAHGGHRIRNITLSDALDEIERLRPALAASAPMTQGEKRSLLARRFWAALDEVCDPGELPLIDELDHREVKDFAAATEAMISAVRVMLTRRHAAVPRPTGSEGEVP